MKTSQSAVARLEGQDDAKESLIDRYAAAIGVEVRRTVVDLDDRQLAAASSSPERRQLNEARHSSRAGR